MIDRTFDELEFFGKIKKYSGLFIGKPSLLSLRDFIFGMHYAFNTCGSVYSFTYFDAFVDWYQNEIVKDWNGYACWWSHILYVSGSDDREAFNDFFHDFEMYLHDKHHLTLPDVELDGGGWIIHK